MKYKVSAESSLNNKGSVIFNPSILAVPSPVLSFDGLKSRFPHGICGSGQPAALLGIARADVGLKLSQALQESQSTAGTLPHCYILQAERELYQQADRPLSS